MRVLNVITVTALVILCMSGGAFAASGSDAAHTGAEQALRTYKGMPMWDQFNFNSADELNSAVVGDGVPVFAFDATKLAADASTLESAMNDANMVEFMVKGNNRDVTRLTVRKTDAGYVRYRFGGSAPRLAQGLASLPASAKPDVRLVLMGAAEFLYVRLPNQELLIAINNVSVGGIPNFKVLTGTKALTMLSELAKGMMKDGAVPGGGLGATAPQQRAATSPWAAPSLVTTIFASGGLYYYRIRRNRSAV
ncbi:MAG: hypothetical protein JWN15_889 [Firmicutes bacterium]|jgi:hypothetical protein|nr:hypothetical protein [Bacillota bacterium]